MPESYDYTKYHPIKKPTNLRTPIINDNAKVVLEKRYYRKDKDGNIIETPQDFYWRTASNIAVVDPIVEEREELAVKFYDMMIDGVFLPNSPTLMNAGTDLGQLSACFVLPVEDSIDGIFDAIKNAAKIHKSGGGTGFSFSRLRPKDSRVGSTGGVASGPVSFMKIFNTATEQVKQGGARRGANMGILRIDHPDIMEFIHAKDVEGEFANFNLSVAITDDFMQSVKNDTTYSLINPVTKQVIKELRAKEVFEDLVKHAWKSGDPGIVFIDRINIDNPTPELGEIEATNPCVIGNTRHATNKGFLRMDELATIGTHNMIATDNRVLDMHSNGVTQRLAKSVLKTGENLPVFTVETEHGHSITATGYHKFYTTGGKIELKDLVLGDELLLQSGEGVWNKDYTLPKLTITARLSNRISKRDASLPQEWSIELGQILGFFVGDGWTSKSSSTTNCIGLCLGGDNRKLVHDIRKKVHTWIGVNGTITERGTCTYLKYNQSAYLFFTRLGIAGVKQEKHVPESIWTAPRESVRGFLQGLFSSDGTVSLSKEKKSCSIRLSASNKQLLNDVQILLSNFGILSKLFLRRGKHNKLLPDGNNGKKEYKCKEQYELIIDGESRDLFIEKIGFINSAKQKKAEEFIASKKRKSNKSVFTTKITSITPAGTEDVYCTTEPETNSIIVNGFVTGNCGEQPLLPYEACNLGSINVAKFVDIDFKNKYKDFDYIASLCVRFLNNVIDASKFPLPEIDKLVKKNRKIGLGIMGFADLLFAEEIPYDSEKALYVAHRIMLGISNSAKNASNGRNATVTTIAPTGTLSIIAGCSSGIEPLFALSFYRNIMDGQKLADINTCFKKYIEKKYPDYKEEIMAHVMKHGTISGYEDFPYWEKSIFATAMEISPGAHLRMQAAFQKHVDNAVSKTINLPNSASENDIYDIYMMAYDLNCKGITVYRDGCKSAQVLYAGEQTAEKKKDSKGQPWENPASRPQYLKGFTQKVNTGHGAMYVTVNELAGVPFEVFATVGKSGGSTAAKAEAIGRLISLALRNGIGTEQVVRQINGICGEKPVFQPGKGLVLSIPDGIAWVLSEAYLGGEKQVENSIGKEYCPECSGVLSLQEGCCLCQSCGFTKCG